MKHYSPTLRTSSGEIVQLVELPVNLGSTDELGLACLAVKSPDMKTAMEACGTSVFDLCVWAEEKGVPPADEWLKCALCHQRYHASCLGVTSKQKPFNCGCDRNIHSFRT